MLRRCLLGPAARLGLSLSALWLLAGCASEPPGPPPNVVLFVLDTMRADALELSEDGLDVTPNLRALAEEGVVFDNAFTHTTWTKPAMATLFTSRYPTQHSIRTSTKEADGGKLVSSALPEVFDTMAERFQAGGYETVGVLNQLHLLPKFKFDQGFDEYFAFRGKSAGALNQILGRWLDARASVGTSSPEGSSSEASSSQAAANIEEKRPVFLYIHYLDPHWPYEERVQSLRETLGPLAMTTEPPRRGNRVEDWLQNGLTESDVDALWMRYLHGVGVADRFMGQALEMLTEAGLMDDTIVLVTSDHGEGMYEHEKLLHGFEPYEELHRVPLLIRLPERMRSDVRDVSALVGLVDVLPTLLDLAGLPKGEGDMGRSLVPLMKGRRPGRDRPVFSESVGIRSLRTERHKLIRHPDGREEFYDLEADPGETASLPCDESCEVLQSEMDELVALLELTAQAESGAVELDESELDRLRALGYLND